jgi:hypothetical protein
MFVIQAIEHDIPPGGIGIFAHPNCPIGSNRLSGRRILKLPVVESHRFFGCLNIQQNPIKENSMKLIENTIIVDRACPKNIRNYTVRLFFCNLVMKFGHWL